MSASLSTVELVGECAALVVRRGKLSFFVMDAINIAATQGNGFARVSMTVKSGMNSEIFADVTHVLLKNEGGLVECFVQSYTVDTYGEVCPDPGGSGRYFTSTKKQFHRMRAKTLLTRAGLSAVDYLPITDAEVRDAMKETALRPPRRMLKL